MIAASCQSKSSVQGVQVDGHLPLDADMVKSLKGYARADDEKTPLADLHAGLAAPFVLFAPRLPLPPL
ncbi:hypothetical protein SC81_22970, partial [Vibrio vulnificus]